MSLRPTSLVLALACLAVSLGACGGSSPPVPSGLTTTTPTAVATATATDAVVVPGAVAPIYRAWAEAICASTARFDAAVAAVQDSIDPRTLSVPDRIARGNRRYEAYIAALQNEARAVGAIASPPGTEPYQRALHFQITELQRLFTEAIGVLSATTSPEQIEAQGAQLQVEVDKLSSGLGSPQAAPSDAAIDALDTVLVCGILLG